VTGYEGGALEVAAVARGCATCAAVVAALVLGSCGESETVNAQLQRELPAVQVRLLADLCDPLEASTGQPISTRRRAQRQSAALLRALNEEPDAKVQTVRMTHNGDVREELTVRELAERHLSGLSRIVQTSDGRAERCARKAADDLRMTIEQ